MAEPLKEIIDLVHRRARFYIAEDDVNDIFVRFEPKRRTKIIFKFNMHFDTATFTCMLVRYQHLFDDLQDTYDVVLVDGDNHFIVDSNTYPIWKKGSGFDARLSQWTS